jgi:hypothetical protein
VSTRRRSAFRGGGATGVLLALGLGTTTLAAAEPDREAKIALAVRDCPPPFDAALRRILLIELGDLLDESRSLEPDGESIEIGCEVEMARITARSPHGELVHNDVRFDTFPGDAAPRAVALAALEALRAVDPGIAERIARRAKASPEPEPKPAAAPPPAASKPRPTRAAVAPRALTRWVAGGVARVFLGEPKTLAAGARLELSRRFVSGWDAGLDVDGTFARRRVDLGAVEARLLSTAAWLGARAGGASWSVTGGIGGRLGLALLEGAPASPGTLGHRTTRPWGGPMLVIRGDGGAGGLALALSLEGGVALAGAEGLSAGAPAIGFTRGWASVSASAGFRY